MIKLVVKEPISIKKYPYADGLCLPGVEYHSKCPQCGKKAVIAGEDYYLSRELTSGEFDWCMPTFECSSCKDTWEEEFKLELKLKVQII